MPTRSILGVLVAIAVTTSMDATGLSAFSALPLFPLMSLFWFLERRSRHSVGFAWGRWGHCGIALLHPVTVLGALGLASVAADAVDLGQTNWQKARINLAIVAVSTILVAILTEEGFFRGWLFASLQRAGVSRGWTLVWSSVAFSLWHLSGVTLSKDFGLPPAQVPVFMINAAVLGAVWGLLRSISGSLIVASVGHGLWNGLAYVLFGYGTRVGALGIRDTAMFGAESGVVGLTVNAVFAAALWRWWTVTRPAPGAAAPA